MSKAFGEILVKIRKQKRLRQGKLYQGLCSSATLSRLEKGDRYADYLLFDALMTRLGKDSLKWEIILKAKDKELLQKRNRMEVLLNIKDLQQLEEDLKQYKIYRDLSPNLHKQYILLMQGNIALERKDYELAVQKYQLALKKTEKDIDFDHIKIEGVYSRNELRILCSLGLAIVHLNTIKNEVKEQYAHQLQVYIETQCTDEWYRLHNYISVLYMHAYFYYKGNDVIKSFEYCKKAIEELIAKRSSFYLKECLQLVETLHQQGLEEEVIHSLGLDPISYFIEILDEWNVENNHVRVEDMENYSHQNLSTISEIMKNTRYCLGKSQEDLMLSKDGNEIILDQAGISKIENGKREPGKDILHHCFWHLKLTGKEKRYTLPLEDENFETQELRWDIDYYLSIHKNELAEVLFKKLKSEIDHKNIYNQQYLKKVEVILQKEKNLITMDTCIEELLKALKLTVPNIEDILENDKKWGYYFKQQELILLLNLGVAYHNEGNYTEALKYYEKLEEYYQNYYILSDSKIYKAVLQNLSSIYGLIGEYEKSIEKSRQCILLEGMFHEMKKKHRAIFNLAWCYGKKMMFINSKIKGQYKAYSKKYFQQALFLAQIENDEEIVSLVKSVCHEWKLLNPLQD